MNTLLRDLPQTPLSPEAEQLALANGDHESIVLHALPQAFGYMKRLSRGRLLDAEILSAAYAALLKAVKNFRSGWGHFLGYARPYMRGELAAEWRAKETVRNSSKHKAPIENDERPRALVATTVDPAFEEIHLRERWEKIQPLIGKVLSALEIRVLEFRFKHCLTLQEAGEKIGRSRERVRQIEGDALRKLRAAFRSEE